MFDIVWDKKAFEQLVAIHPDQRTTITYAAARLKDWPECRGVQPCSEKQHKLKVGRYQVLFDVDSTIEINEINYEL